MTSFTVKFYVTRKYNDRLAVEVYLNSGFLCKWWLESRDGRRYMPLKPAPPKFWAIPNIQQHLGEIHSFLMTAEHGNELTITINQ